MTLCEDPQRGQEGVFPVSYQEMQALEVSTGEAVPDSQLQSLDREKHQTNGKEILPFLLLYDMSIETMPFERKQKANAMIAVWYEKLEEFQQKRGF